AVTNHGFTDGHVTSFPAVLQAGTAVLVDRYGSPVTKCFCGNPLTKPTASSRPTYTGARWPSFAPGGITIIQQTTVTIDSFTLVDPATGASFNRPSGSAGSADQPGAAPSPKPAATPGGQPSPTTSTTPTPEAGGSPTPTSSPTVKPLSPVVACPSSYGMISPPGPARLPDEIATRLPPDVAAQLAFYSDQNRVIDPVLAPRGWSCSAALGADGSGGLDVWPSGTQKPEKPGGNMPANPDQQLVEAYTAGAQQAAVYEHVCAFDPAVADRYYPFYANSMGCRSSPVSGEKVVHPHSDASLVLFEDPPGIHGNAAASGGNYSAHGAQLYEWHGSGISSTATCMLPDSQRALCTAVLNDFIERRWMMEQGG
ncbi:MAG TPA: DUF6777 domain-containing protein, partial [Dermatophilaceae bacterium]